MNVIQKALSDIEAAWEEMKNTPVQMTIEEFERRILRQAKRDGIAYSSETGMWLDNAKKMIADPRTPNDVKNLLLGEANPPETRHAVQKFIHSYLKICKYAEWAYKDLTVFLEDKSKDKLLRHFLLWRVFPPAEALHKFYHLKPRGKNAEKLYFSLRPAVILRKT